MRHPLIPRLILLCVLGAFCAQVQAEPIAVQLKTMGVSFGIKGVNCKTDGQFVPMSLESFIPSESTVSYSGDNPLVLYHATQANGKTQMVAVGQVPFPSDASGKHFLLVVSGSGDGPYSGSALSDSLADFPLQSARLVNLTPLTLMVACAGKNFGLKPGQYAICPVGDVSDYIVEVSYSRGGSMTPGTNGQYTNQSGNRVTYFMILDNAAELHVHPNLPASLRIVPREDNGQDQTPPSKKQKRRSNNNNNSGNNDGFDQ